MRALFAETALLPEGWARDVRITLAPGGTVAGCDAGVEPGDCERLAGPVVPGMPNLHSHAFQRAMAGLTERAGETRDSFWTWREVMYRFVERLEPEDVGGIAAQLYVEMLKAGYTAVAEFHYLHHDKDGRRYADRNLLGKMILAAASVTGIGVTLLPVLYQTNGFGGVPASPAQRRFVNGVEDILGMIDALRREVAGTDHRIGLAPHSLRAVPPEALAEAAAGLRSQDPDAPIHVHVAEQRREVEECLAWSGARPVEWLLGNAALDASWCLVHATHVTAAEAALLARSGAVAGLCPTTEANLGDGIFPFAAFAGARGSWGVGSDSHISVDPREELRWLEYGQRLTQERRNLAGLGAAGSTGAVLWKAALAGGAAALGRHIGALAPGRRADLLVLDADAPALYGRSGDALLDSLVFAGIGSAVRDVMVGGRWLVREGRHIREDKIAAGYRRAIDRLTGD
jgi:formimidoylglutamate deiminase